MKLFRHHSERFEAQIQEANGFLTDKSREFNFDEKNSAQLFFYATTPEGAEQYSVEGETRLWEYETSARLLDLRVKKNRRLLTTTIAAMAARDNEVKADSIKNVPAEALKAGDRLSKNSVFRATTPEDVINDNPYNGRTFWNQSATDYEMGVILKKEVAALGYEGIILQATIACVEVALFQPAKKPGVTPA